MFKEYQDIFDRRGGMYHQAMMKYPLARQQEFEQVIQLSDLQDDQIICDVPSGGCYLKNFIQQKVKLFSVETSEQFLRCSQPSEENNTLLCQDLGHISLMDETIDRAISLAGSHHLENRPAFYQDVRRILKPGGIFCLADVCKGSGVDGFLNTFVDQHNSMGHEGDFLDDTTQLELRQAGFDVPLSQVMAYHWHFQTIAAMVDGCRLLFGIDQASHDQILGAISDYLGYQATHEGCLMNWELYFFQAVKPN